METKRVTSKHYSKTDKGDSFVSNGRTYTFLYHKPTTRRTRGGWQPEKWVYEYAYLHTAIPEITIDKVARAVAKKLDGIIDYISPSGSCYIHLPITDERIRISDHFVKEHDLLSPKIREDYNIVKRYFTEESINDIVSEIKSEINL